jgi:hypothetical protein
MTYHSTLVQACPASKNALRLFPLNLGSLLFLRKPYNALFRNTDAAKRCALPPTDSENPTASQTNRLNSGGSFIMLTSQACVCPLDR